ncbi:hypothetical protein TeGR_g1901 [Tetraparma gracilis]|uniref:Uncharacterized protein n=1 Tax=Tetraparma gracilis TaxID=2962635 RepID=A0ABQ6MLC2_9STRA|nr:hypothetical protein TeGR_g1901 [Tetraparma gracilis]
MSTKLPQHMLPAVLLAPPLLYAAYLLMRQPPSYEDRRALVPDLPPSPRATPSTLLDDRAAVAELLEDVLVSRSLVLSSFALSVDSETKDVVASFSLSPSSSSAAAPKAYTALLVPTLLPALQSISLPPSSSAFCFLYDSTPTLTSLLPSLLPSSPPALASHLVPGHLLHPLLLLASLSSQSLLSSATLRTAVSQLLPLLALPPPPGRPKTIVVPVPPQAAPSMMPLFFSLYERHDLAFIRCSRV